jgi:hypothetical protein
VLLLASFWPIQPHPIASNANVMKRFHSCHSSSPHGPRVIRTRHSEMPARAATTVPLTRSDSHEEDEAEPVWLVFDLCLRAA